MEKIKEFIETSIRPILQSHGGNIEYVDITPDMHVKVKLLGACATCPGAQQTLTEVVELSLRQAFPAIRGVEPVFEADEELIAQALAILRKKEK